MEEEYNDAAARAYAAITSELDRWGAPSSHDHDDTEMALLDDTPPKDLDDDEFRFAPTTELTYGGDDAVEGYHDILLTYLQHRKVLTKRNDLSIPNEETELEEEMEECELEYLKGLSSLCQNRIKGDERCWERNEGDLWNLLYYLRKNGVEYLLYTPTGYSSPELDINSTPEQIIRSLSLTGPSPNLFIRRMTILAWIQSCLSTSTHLLPPSNRNVMWPCTLHHLKLHRNGSIDPDAPLRSNNTTPLQSTDTRDEIDLLQSCLSLLLSGNSSQMFDVCRRAGQPWRAASFSGSNNNNPRRFLWKRTCHRLSRELYRRTKRYRDAEMIESAIYSILGNDLEGALSNPLLGTWERSVFVYFYDLVERHVDEMLTKHAMKQRKIATKFPFRVEEEKEQREHLNTTAKLSNVKEESVFESFLESPYESVRNEAKTDIRLIQSGIISGKHQLKEYLQSYFPPDKNDVPLFRLITHLVLYLSTLDPDFLSLEEVNTLLSEYISLLRDHSHCWKLVALYTSLLPQEDLVKTYADFILPMEQTADRKLVLHKARQFFPKGTDCIILKTVIQSILIEPNSPSSSHRSSDDISPSDMKKLKSIQWLTFYHEHYPEALIQANTLLRQFLSDPSFKLHPAEYFLREIFPDDVVDVAVRHANQGMEDVIGEYEAICGYVRAHSAFAAWRKSVAVMLLPDKSLDSEKWKEEEEKRIAVWMERRGYLQKMKGAMRDVLKCANEAEEKLLGVLEFPGGWLFCQEEEGEDARRKEMKVLRERCLPETVFLLHVLWDQMGDWMKKYSEEDIVRSLVGEEEVTDSPFREEYWYRKAVGLVDLVEREEYGLLDAFEGKQMERFLGMVAESAVKLLECTGTIGMGSSEGGEGGVLAERDEEEGGRMEEEIDEDL